MLINFIDKSCAKILLFLAVSPGSNYRRNEIKDKIQLNNVTLDIALNKLIAFNILINKKKIYSLNISNELAKQVLNEVKGISSLPLIIQYLSLDLINKLIELKGIKSIILFGSYSKLIFSDKSDLDIAIILNNSIKNKFILDKKVSLISRKVSKKYKKEVHYYLLLESDLKHKNDPLIKDILRNGKVLF